MIEKIEPWIKGKRILLLGYGREGQSTWNVLRRLGTYEALDIADLKAPAALPEDGTVWHTGPDYQKCMDDYDVVFKSPGIVLEQPENEYRCSILSQTEVFFQCFRDQIIGITGTKGKSTVTTLLYHLLKQAGMDALLVGNIGIPALDHMEEVKPDTRIVFELSCHQLEYMTVSPHIGILVNIHEEHLDHYGTMEKYVEAKHHIFKNQRPDDILICNVQCLPEEGTCPSGLIRAGMDGSGKELDVVQEQDGTWVHFRGKSFCIPTDEIKLLGQHNYFDIGVAYGVCSILGMDDQVFARGLKTYEPLPHRLQYIGEREGVKYYDDSISTICDTTIQALKTLKDTDTVLIGGMDRGIDYRELIEYLSDCQVPHIILMEATGKRIYQEIHKYYPEFKNRARLILAEHLEDGVKRARQITRPGTSCVLSPAAASYGIFRNFEERGETFSRLVFNK
ncbi:UDP-N-acetylmuramoyl-L-alanine--D-glutamate ligase [Enterocloster bolteae]|uniref:UDP-N-acetylmuramoyl-L-alanine--D-glutamate ligase n=1 Tax=Enterocloster bolteae TaxID=208479 RepID=UPI002A813745|nr:UDP-N-acetylmuramoyl-L-alanine--D-glutamate ligase [Enterocloster bolteae]